MHTAISDSLSAQRNQVANVRYGKPGTILFEFQNRTYAAPEPMDVMPAIDSKGTNAIASRSWALKQILSGSAIKINPMTDYRRLRAGLPSPPRRAIARKHYRAYKKIRNIDDYIKDRKNFRTARTVFYRMKTNKGTFGMTGFPISLKALPGFRFVIHRDPFTASAWSVAEFRTGRIIGKGRNRTAAVAHANHAAAQFARNFEAFTAHVRKNTIN
jgi:hypothetical protein